MSLYSQLVKLIMFKPQLLCKLFSFNYQLGVHVVTIVHVHVIIIISTFCPTLLQICPLHPLLSSNLYTSSFVSCHCLLFALFIYYLLLQNFCYLSFEVKSIVWLFHNRREPIPLRTINLFYSILNCLNRSVLSLYKDINYYNSIVRLMHNFGR